MTDNETIQILLFVKGGTRRFCSQNRSLWKLMGRVFYPLDPLLCLMQGVFGGGTGQRYI